MSASSLRKKDALVLLPPVEKSGPAHPAAAALSEKLARQAATKAANEAAAPYRRLSAPD